MLLNESKKRGGGEKNHYPWLQWLSIASLVACIILLALLIHTPWTRTIEVEESAPASCMSHLYVENATLCNQTNECLLGFATGEEGEESCAYLPLPNNVTNCSSGCYSNGTCDGGGKCVGDRTECVGYCVRGEFGYCAIVEHINLDILNGEDPVTKWVYANWNNPSSCFFGTCVFTVLNIYAGSSNFTIADAPPGELTYSWTPLGAKTACVEYFQPDLYLERKECIRSERYLLDEDVIRSYNDIGNSLYGNDTFPFQLSICVLYYSCGIPIVEASAKKRALEEERVKTREAWGFRSTGKKHETPDGPPLQLTSPMMRNLFWKDLRAGVDKHLPGFLDVVNKQYVEEKKRKK